MCIFTQCDYRIHTYRKRKCISNKFFFSNKAYYFYTISESKLVFLWYQQTFIVCNTYSFWTERKCFKMHLWSFQNVSDSLDPAKTPSDSVLQMVWILLICQLRVSEGYKLYCKTCGYTNILSINLNWTAHLIWFSTTVQDLFEGIVCIYWHNSCLICLHIFVWAQNILKDISSALLVCIAIT